jgi:putative membrane protein
MWLLGWLFWIGLFLVMLGFALSNTDTATLRFFGIPEFEWRAPMVLFLFLFFAAGALLGVIATMPRVLRLRRGIGQVRRELDAATRAAATRAAADAPPAVDGARGPEGGAGPRGL